jgi:hypothetical protein
MLSVRAVWQVELDPHTLYETVRAITLQDCVPACSELVEIPWPI